MGFLMPSFYLMVPNRLSEKLNQRIQQNALRTLQVPDFEVDFFSNDYLGFAKNQEIIAAIDILLTEKQISTLGSTGSRLISGNSKWIQQTEQYLAKYHQTEAALLFNSGYDANLGLLSSVPQKGDLVLYDALVHASILDGIRLSHATAYKYPHLDDVVLEEMLQKFEHQFQHVYVVTESVFSMDGDSPDLNNWTKLLQKYHAFGIVDEAHALGLYPKGLVQHLNLQEQIFARVFTFGKAIGTHGAAVVGNETLIQYLVNFARSFIYTTAPSTHQVTNIWVAYHYLEKSNAIIAALKENIQWYQELMKQYFPEVSTNNTPIQVIPIGGNEATKQVANQLKKEGFGVKEVLHPTVPKGTERIRICLHSYNTKIEIKDLVHSLKKSI
ncbi:MAG: aminotransferase class I/II-fold pyridoxal phosphate-dependent enzyme [Flavobacterium sp.]